MNSQKAAISLALIATGPFIWAACWMALFPSFQLMYQQVYGEWTAANFHNYLLMGISGIYLIGFLLIAWKTDVPHNVVWTNPNPKPVPDIIDPPDDPPPQKRGRGRPRKSEQGLASSSPSPPVMSSPQLPEILDMLQKIGKRMEGIEERQAKVKPFLALASNEGE